MPEDIVKVKKFVEDETPSYDDHLEPVVQIPTAVEEGLTTAEVDDLEKQSLSEYKQAKEALEASLADVATHDPSALDFAGELSQRVLTIMEVAVELGLIEVDGISADRDKLERVGVSAEAIASRPEGFLDELKQKSIKTKIISETGIQEGVEKGNRTESGFVGFSPLAIENATKGNLRERMYIPYKTTHGFTKELFANPDHVAAINKRLAEQGIEWQLNEKVISGLKEQTTGKRGGLYAYGAYATSRDGSRTSQSDQHRIDYAQRNPTTREMKSARMPLSERELLAQSGDLDSESDIKVQWLPGEAWSGVLESRDHPTLRAADATGDLMLTGISGTTDSILTLGHMVGMFDGADSEEKMRDGLLACIGWMVDAKDHTAHEILTSGKTFGLDYVPGPEGYKQIKPGDDDFLERLRHAQKERGFEMPDVYLSREHVSELAQSKMREHEPEEEKRVEEPDMVDKENVDPNLAKSETVILHTIEKQRYLKDALKSIIDAGKKEKEENKIEESILRRLDR